MDRTRQGYYKHRNNLFKERNNIDELLVEVRQLRHLMPKLGVRKIFSRIKERIKELSLKIGRDKLFNILRKEGLLVLRKRRKKVITTDSNHPFKKHKNLIKDLQIVRKNQVFVGDITFISVEKEFLYLFLLTDIYSRKIVGYSISDNLSVSGSIDALKMAIANVEHPEKLIHHSDRGIQYCAIKYTDILEKLNIKISMTEINHCYENSIAERVNGILKDEFALDTVFQNAQQARKAILNAIYIYNEHRPHMSINYETPNDVYEKSVA